MTPQTTAIRIAELELWLMENPENINRTTIETDLRKLKESEAQPVERDTFDLREHNIYNV